MGSCMKVSVFQHAFNVLDQVFRPNSRWFLVLAMHLTWNSITVVRDSSADPSFFWTALICGKAFSATNSSSDMASNFALKAPSLLVLFHQPWLLLLSILEVWENRLSMVRFRPLTSFVVCRVPLISQPCLSNVCFFEEWFGHFKDGARSHSWYTHCSSVHFFGQSSWRLAEAVFIKETRWVLREKRNILPGFQPQRRGDKLKTASGR